MTIVCVCVCVSSVMLLEWYYLIFNLVFVCLCFLSWAYRHYKGRGLLQINSSTAQRTEHLKSVGTLTQVTQVLSPSLSFLHGTRCTSPPSLQLLKTQAVCRAPSSKKIPQNGWLEQLLRTRTAKSAQPSKDRQPSHLGGTGIVWPGQ